MKNAEVSDEVFEKAARELRAGAGIEKAFYTKVYGPSHRNRDGSSRTRIIAQCEVGDSLELRPEPDNEFDPDAMAVVRLGFGEQLGYLEVDLAAEVAEDFRKHGPCWLVPPC